MPTNAQRALSIVDTILNKPSNAAQRNRILAAYGEMVPPPSQTTDAIAAYFIERIRSDILATVRDYESRAAVNAAKATADAAVGTDFAPAP